MADPAGNLVDRIEALKEEKPLLYDAQGRPLARLVGFRPAQKEKR